MAKLTWTAHENVSGSVTIARCCQCEELIPQKYFANPDEARAHMDQLYREHLIAQHSGEGMD